MIGAAQQERLQERVSQELARFDVPALLDAVQLLGYRPSEVCFRSRPTLSHQSSVIESIEFDAAARRVFVWVSVGLQSSQGALPAYFWELQQDQRDEDMTQFLWFLERPLLSQRLAAEFPERSPEVFEDWPQTRRLMLLLLRLGSPSGMHWLMSAFFPEVEVSVRRVPGSRRLRTPDLALGGAELGEGHTMGGVTDLPVGGVEVSLISGQDDDRDAAQWIAEAQRRLKEQLLPILNDQDPYLYLKVQLVLRSRIESARLLRDRYVGVNRMHRPGNEPSEHEQLVLFQGEVRTGLASEQMNFALPGGNPRSRLQGAR